MSVNTLIETYLNELRGYKIPDILYHGSSNKITEIKGKIFLTPLMGIASIFVIDKKDIKSIKGYGCNLNYLQWGYKDNRLIKPLKVVNITHNIKGVKKKETGVSSGYLHIINIKGLKNKISLFTSKNPNREVIYSGTQSLPIIEKIPHTIRWTCEFSKENFELYGDAKKLKDLEANRL